MFTEKRKKGIITVFALLLAALIAGGVFSVSAKYTTRWSSTNTYVKVEGIFKVTFDAGTNGGKIAGTADDTKDLYAKKGESSLYSNSAATVSVSAPVATNTEMRFDGWYTAASGGEKVIDVDRSLISSTTYTDAFGKWNISSDITLYAHYVAYKITFDAETNGGTITGLTELYAKNGSTRLYTTKEATTEAAAPIAEYSDAEHYYFDGWYTTDSGTDEKIGYVDNVLTVLTSFTGLTDDNTVLYAQYKPYTYVVTFDGNAPSGKTVTGTTANWEKTYDEAASALSANGYSVTDHTYTFVGWMTEATGTSKQFTDKQFVTVSDLLSESVNVTDDPSDRTKKKIILYARWAIVYTVTFKNMTNSTGTIVEKYYNLDDTLYTDSTLTTKVTSMPTTGNGSRSGLSYWTTTKTGKVGTGDSATAAPLVISAGNVETGTYTDENGQSFTITGTSDWTLNSNITLYAVWYKINYYKDTKQIPKTAGYIELEYIASTNGGYQRLDTGVNPHTYQQNGGIELRFGLVPTNLNAYLDTGTQYYYGTSENANFRYENVGTLISPNYKAYFKKKNERTKYVQHNMTENARYNYDITYTKTAVTVNRDNVSLGSATYTGVVFDNLNLMFFRVGTGLISIQSSSMRLHYLTILSNGSDVKNFVPARSASGTLGLYDTISGSFVEKSEGSDFACNSDHEQTDLIYGEPVELAKSPSDCEYTHYIYESGVGKEYISNGWTYEMGREANDYIKSGTYTDLFDHVSPDSTAGNVFVNLYTGVWVEKPVMMSKALFRSPNKDIEYVYVEPVNKEDEDVIEEENMNE